MERDWEEASRIFLHEMHEYYFVSEWSGVVLGAFCWNNIPSPAPTPTFIRSGVGRAWGGVWATAYSAPLVAGPVWWSPSLYLSLASVK